MRQVIDGKVYDTEKAEEVYAWANMADRGNFQFCSEALYRTPKGAYFVAGEGGAMSAYAAPLGGGSWSGGSGIRVVSESEAIEWLEEHGGTEALLRHFASELEEA